MDRAARAEIEKLRQMIHQQQITNATQDLLITATLRALMVQSSDPERFLFEIQGAAEQVLSRIETASPDHDLAERLRAGLLAMLSPLRTSNR